MEVKLVGNFPLGDSSTYIFLNIYFMKAKLTGYLPLGDTATRKAQQFGSVSAGFKDCGVTERTHRNARINCTLLLQ